MARLSIYSRANVDQVALLGDEVTKYGGST